MTWETFLVWAGYAVTVGFVAWAAVSYRKADSLMKAIEEDAEVERLESWWALPVYEETS